MKWGMRLFVMLSLLAVMGCGAQTVDQAQAKVNSLESERSAYIEERSKLPLGTAATAAQKARSKELQKKIADINNRFPAARKALNDAKRAAGVLGK